MKIHFNKTTVFIICFAIFFACKPTGTNSGTIPNTTNPNPTDTITQTDTIQIPTPFHQQGIPQRIELPEVKNKRWYIEHNHYAMEYDTAQRHAIWVAYVFHANYNQKNTGRSDAWAHDPIIAKEFQSLKNKSQTYPNYDRGHLIASEDRVFSEIANKETFYFSNMSPQLSWFNQQIWKTLETTVRKWAQSPDCDTLYVVTGGAINKGVDVIGKLNDRNNVTIPKYYFKALVKRKGNTFHGIAFWIENKRHESAKITHKYAITIRELEKKTNINFFPNLNSAIPENPKLEETVETNLDTTKWAM